MRGIFRTDENRTGTSRVVEEIKVAIKRNIIFRDFIWRVLIFLAVYAKLASATVPQAASVTKKRRHRKHDVFSHDSS